MKYYILRFGPLASAATSLILFQNFTSSVTGQAISEVSCSKIMSDANKGVYEVKNSIKIKHDGQCSPLKVRLKITKSNMTLDCNGVTIDTSAKDVDPAANKNAAISILNLTASQTVSNVIVRNCNINNMYEGVRVGWGQSVSKRYKDLKLSSSELTRYAPKYIRLENIKINNAYARGMFLGDHVSQVEVVDSKIEGTLGMAIYLEFGSSKNKIINSQFINNGHGDADKKMWVREAISVDSSAHNIFKNNIFKNNGLGGIYLYKNCWEGAGTGNDDMPRTQNSNFNIISENRFLNEKVGISIASRQDQNLVNFKCGDPEIKEHHKDAYIDSKGRFSPAQMYYEDYSRGNQVYKNIFEDIEARDAIGVKVADNDNFIVGNIFNKIKSPIVVGSKIRPGTVRPDGSIRSEVRRNLVANNQFDRLDQLTSLVQLTNGAEKFGANNLLCANYYIKAAENSPLTIESGDLIGNACSEEIVKKLLVKEMVIVQ